MRDRELGFLYSSKSRLVNPKGETAGEFGMGGSDDMSALSGSQKAALSGSQKGRRSKQEKEDKDNAIMTGMESCASSFREGISQLSHSIGTVGYHLAHDPSQIDLWRSTVISQIEQRIAIAKKKGYKKRLARLEKLLEQKEEQMFTAEDE